MIKLFNMLLKEHKMNVLKIILFVVLEVALNIIIPFAIGVAVDQGVIDKNELMIILITILISIFYIALDFLANKSKNEMTKVLSKVNEDIVKDLVKVLMIMLKTPLLIIGILVVVLAISYKIALIFIFLVPVIILGFYLILSNTFGDIEESIHNHEQFSLHIDDKIKGMGLIKAYNNMESEINYFNTFTKKIYKLDFKINRLLAFLLPLIKALIYLTIILISWFGGRMIILSSDINFSMGNFITCFIYTFMLLINIMKFVNNITCFVTLNYKLEKGLNSKKQCSESLNQNKININDLKEVTKYIFSKNRITWSVIIISIVIGSILSMGGILLIGQVIDKGIISSIYNEHFVELANILVVMVLILFLSIFFFFISSFLTVKVVQKWLRILRNEMFSHLMYLPLSYFEKHKNIKKIFLNDIDNFEYLINAIINNLTSGLLLVISIIIMLKSSLLLTIIFFILVIIKVSRFKDYSSYILIFIFFLSSFLTLKENFTIGTLVIFMMFCMIVIMTSEKIINETENIKYKLPSYKEIRNFMLEDKEINNGVVKIVNVKKDWRGLREVTESTHYKAWKKNGELLLVKGEIVFDNVSYKHSNEIILKNLSFKVKAGDKLAIVGNTEKEKNAIINLLEGFDEASSGIVTIDEIDLREINLVDLRNIMGNVDEMSFFKGSIYENIIYGCPSASRYDILKVMRIARLYDWIRRLPLGLDDVINNNFSNCEKWRLALARELLRKPKILVTNIYINEDNKNTLFKNTKKAMHKNIMIIFDNEFSEVDQADNILVFKEGKIIEQGTHDELIAKKGAYYKLFEDAKK